MPRRPNPFLHRGFYVTTTGGKTTRLCRAEEGPEVAAKRLAEFLAARKEGVTQSGTASAKRELTIREAFSRYMEHARAYYRLPNGESSREIVDIPLSFRELLAMAGDTPAAGITKRLLKEMREAMIRNGLCRRVVNQRYGRVRRVLEWLAEEELIPDAVAGVAKMLRNLPAHRSAAHETEPVRAVDPKAVTATLRFMRSPWREMVRLQLVTGMRPGEVVSLRASYLTREGPDMILADFGIHHKMAHKKRPRVVLFGPQGTRILEPLIEAAQECERDELFPAFRGTGTARVRSYSSAVAAAAKRARVTHWHPNQLRHTFATQVREKLGLDAAQVVLGHAKADVTQVYAKPSETVQRRVAEELG